MLDYAKGEGELENWLISETAFSAAGLGKCEAILCLGNGYMGLRSSTEEPYFREKRNFFINGTFNRSQKNEVTELPNLADSIQMDIRVDGERFSLEVGETNDYLRQLNLKTAELSRSFIWTSPKGKILSFKFRRFVSLEHLHLLGFKVEVKSLSGKVQFAFDSGINAQMTNSGSQHFLEGERRIFDHRFLQLTQTTNESGIDIVHQMVHQVSRNGKEIDFEPEMDMERRKVWLNYTVDLQEQDVLTIEKLVTVHTSRDKENVDGGYELTKMQQAAMEELKRFALTGYEKLFEMHRQAWQEKVWDLYSFNVESEKGIDELAIRFAIYHLTIMAPAHDERMGIGAKALSGEGYKGHAFWDTEIFILPFFIFSNPKVAKSLLIYRFLGLEGAHKKAAAQGYKGAMYPWEMAWPKDGETTPEWGDIDIVTGKQSKIWSGLIEHHISADIAFAVYQYEQATGDQEFMDAYGYEMIFDTAAFWASRLEWNSQKERYEINDVIGPDEYKEHVDNNAFTNYMAHANLKMAIYYYRELKETNPEVFKKLSKKMDLESLFPEWREKAANVYLPEPREEDFIIPQDDAYLGLEQIDLSKYKNQAKVRAIYRDYNSEQINELQVTKQADVLVLLYLLEQLSIDGVRKFPKEVKQANFDFYEPRTLHDSSLSTATHAILASDLGYQVLAYSLFQKSIEIDLGGQMDTSDDGVHAAAIGGLWKTAVFGFAGIRMKQGKLAIHPRLPANWRSMEFNIKWQGHKLHLAIRKDHFNVTVEGAGNVTFESFGQVFECENSIQVPLGAHLHR